MRIAIGTAQFGMRYGVANAAGQISREVAASILRCAAAQGIDTLDTAIAYGESEACLGEIGVSNWHIATKLPALPHALADVDAWVDEQVSGSLHRLAVPQLDALLLHRSADVLGARGAALQGALRRVKEKGLTKLLGVSIYDPTELDHLWPVFRPDLVQAPFNVLDRRVARSGWLGRMVAAGVRVHTRSAFLQGLLLMAPGDRPAYFRPWAPLLDRWLGWCSEHCLSPLHVALRFALAQTEVECVIVGIDSTAQLEQVLAVADQATSLPPFDFQNEDRDLIEPSRWKLS